MSDVLERIRRLGLLDPPTRRCCNDARSPHGLQLYGKVGGFLDNRKQNANVVLEHVAARLGSEYGMAEALYRAKFIYSRLAEPVIIDEMAERCDFVIAAIGD
jgi:hypothetical protein